MRTRRSAPLVKRDFSAIAGQALQAKTPNRAAESSTTVFNDLVLSDTQRRTIYALSTPPGKAGVAVVRISGPDALAVRQQMVRTPSRRKRNPEPWRLERCSIIDPVSEEVLDDGLVVFFKGPKSFTTEDVVELHLHSGRAIISAVLTALSRLPFCRPAEPGEFTRRAFEGGRLDLTQVEGLKDLIDAETEVQRKSALRAAGGATRAVFDGLRGEILMCLSLCEAAIDFGEEDVEDSVLDKAWQLGEKLRERMVSILTDDRRGEILRSGVRLTIFGPPNAGKSSLLNFLAQREAAIVTHIPGTTRDILELSLDIGGLPVIVADTAGLRKTTDVVESIGVDRAQKAIESSDISLLVLSLPDTVEPGSEEIIVPPSIKPLITPETFVLFNKADLLPESTVQRLHEHAKKQLQVPNIWTTSLASKVGTGEFLSGFSKALQQRYNLLEAQNTAEPPLITHSRHRKHLETALLHLEAFLVLPTDELVFAAEELRYAAQAVGKISGIIDSEDVLDVIFREFCIGK
ncbi:tRNA modification GTPase TrmE [Dentipellis sp. KUC8613]|nr:tRNA modification GTPase TrmE [Dentipellis sp. KUC8613]